MILFGAGMITGALFAAAIIAHFVNRHLDDYLDLLKDLRDKALDAERANGR